MRLTGFSVTPHGVLVSGGPQCQKKNDALPSREGNRKSLTPMGALSHLPSDLSEGIVFDRIMFWQVVWAVFLAETVSAFNLILVCQNA